MILKRFVDRGLRLRQARAALLFLVGGALLALPACDNGGAPPVENNDPVFSFLPEADTVTMLSTDQADFQVRSQPEVTFSVNWILGGQPLNVGPSLRYRPDYLGVRTLRAVAEYEGVTASRDWQLQVLNDHPLDFGFVPADSQLSLVDMQQQEFQVTTDFPFPVTYTWTYHGQPVGSDSAFNFTAAGAGPDSLQVSFEADGQLMSRTWRMAVAPYLPPAVPVVLTENEPWPGSVRVIWEAVQPVVFPISDYLLAASFSGPINDENWDEALPLGSVAHAAAEPWPRVLLTQEDGMLPGQYAWFALRTRDSRGYLSSVIVNGQHELSEERWVEGTVTDELGQVLPGVQVRDNVLHLEAVTDQLGRYRLGPFAHYYPIDIWTLSPDENVQGEPGTSWFDYRVDGLELEVPPVLDFTLLTRWGVDPECPEFHNNFLLYFLNMTSTAHPQPLRPNQRLYRWEQYPVSVHIPAYENNGIDFQVACAQTVDWWNQIMGEDYFTLTEDPGTAQIIFLFDDQGELANGETTLLAPQDQNYDLGEVIPERMQVYIRNTFTEVRRIQETSLHELGHTLGVCQHAFCNGPGYLMYVTANGVLNDGWESAIHEDEQNLVRTIRHLPQGYEMAGFE
jgi:hypothetical protein